MKLTVLLRMNGRTAEANFDLNSEPRGLRRFQRMTFVNPPTYSVGAAMVWATRVDDGVTLVRIGITNGVVEEDGACKGHLYFEDLEVQSEPGTVILGHPRYGEWIEDRQYTIASSFAGEHFLPMRATIWRRFLVIDATVPHWRQEQYLLRPWFVGAQPIEGSFKRVSRAIDTRDLLEALTQQQPVLGTADLRGQRHCGPILGRGNVYDSAEQGGGGVSLCHDWESTPRGGLWRSILGDLDAERHWCAAYSDRGEHMTRRRLGYGFEYAPTGQQELPPFDHDAAALDHVNGCGYVTELMRRPKRIVASHLVRAYRNAWAAFSLSNDPASLEQCRCIAEDVMIQYAKEGINGDTSDQAPFSMAMQLARAKRHPHLGGDITRSEAWTTRIVARMLKADNTNERLRSWVAMKMEVLSMVQMPNGFPYAAYSGSGLEQNRPWDLGMPAYLRAAPAWQLPFWISMLTELRSFDEGGMLKEMAMRACIGLYGHSVPKVQGAYGPPWVGNPMWLGVATGTEALPMSAFTGVGNGQPFYDRDALMRTWLWTRDRRLVQWAMENGIPASSVEELANQLESGDPDSCAFAAKIVRSMVSE